MKYNKLYHMVAALLVVMLLVLTATQYGEVLL